MPVGAAIVVPIGHNKIPHLLCAPTMLLPQAVASVNCYWAMVAILRTVSGRADLAENVFCPGLGTGVGRVVVADAAHEMASAYADWQRRHK